MANITITKGDYGYNQGFTIYDADESAYDLTDYTITLKVWSPGTSSTLLIDSACTIDVAASGTCHYVVKSGDFDTVGMFYAKLELTKSGVVESVRELNIVVVEGNHYCTVEMVKDSLRIDNANNDDLIMTVIMAVDELIENYCDRKFTLTTDTRYFDGTKEPLFIEDLVTVTTFKLDQDGDATYEKELATTDYNLLPYNETTKLRAELTPSSSISDFADGIKKGVQIIGTWGYSTIPSSIRMVALIQVSRFYKRSEAAWATTSGSAEFGVENIMQGLDADVKRLLNPYKREVY